MSNNIMLHDYAGHPFQMQLARSLAKRGHNVHHCYFKDDLTPRGALQPMPDDPSRLSIEGIGIAGAFKKYSYWNRYRSQIEYGRNVAKRLAKHRPDILICANTPLDALVPIQQSCQRLGIQLILWLQDMLSVGMSNVLKRKLGPIGALIGAHYTRLEKRLLRRADRIVCITDDFMPILKRWGVPSECCTTIENWAPLDELQPHSGPMVWPREHGLQGKRLVIYSGTLGFKHDPDLLLNTASALKAMPEFNDVAVVVISQGPGADYLGEQKTVQALDNLHILPWQPFDRLAEVLSSAIVLTGVLRAEAGVFCVPSKVLSYLCIGKPILLAAPAENLASRTLLAAQAGCVVPPEQPDALTVPLIDLLRNPQQQSAFGENARLYAQNSFDIDRITDRFEALWGAAGADRRQQDPERQHEQMTEDTLRAQSLLQTQTVSEPEKPASKTMAA